MGEFSISSPNQGLTTYKGSMYPVGFPLHHNVEGKLPQFATKGCPTMTGKPCTLIQIKEAIDRGPHVSALQPVAMKILAEEVAAKYNMGQCKVVLCDNINYNPLEELKVSQSP